MLPPKLDFKKKDLFDDDFGTESADLLDSPMNSTNSKMAPPRLFLNIPRNLKFENSGGIPDKDSLLGDDNDFGQVELKLNNPKEIRDFQTNTQL